MPRTAKSAALKTNRTDLNQPGPQQPVRSPTGLPYGEAKSLEQAQRSMPLPAGNGSVTPTQANPAQGQGVRPVPPTPAPDPMASVLGAAQAHPFQSVGLGVGTQRPSEPVTTGLTVGPGAGPEAMVGVPNRQGPVSSTLKTLAASTGSQSLAAMAAVAEGQGL